VPKRMRDAATAPAAGTSRLEVFLASVFVTVGTRCGNSAGCGVKTCTGRF
jgi:hypothetical protein